jgi:F1F0 ATPase subunit 2
MTMNETFILILAWVAGLMLGSFFFVGLWWTVRRGVVSKQPAILFLSSFLLRMGITVSGFLIIGRGDWKRLVACLVGFVMARLMVIWLTRQPLEASHAH